MLSRIINRFKHHPLLYYAASIAATWAGVGSLMNTITVAQEYGIIPLLLWAAGNTAACVVFGVFAPIIPKLREVYRSKTMRLVAGVMCVFQIWLTLNGIQAAFVDTPLGGTFGIALAYGLALLFIVLLYRFGLIRNVLTDDAGWAVVYILAAVLAAAALMPGAHCVLPLGLDAPSLAVGAEKALLLIPGAFLYPYFFELLDYNERNADGARTVNIRVAFMLGGLLFGLYLLFAFLLAWAVFTPGLQILKAVLITLVGASTLSSFLYSIYLTFGGKLGLAVNLASVAAWQFLIPLGVMGVWTMMSTIRIYIVAASIVAALVWAAVERKAVKE